MRTEPTLTLADMREITGISIAAIQKLLDQLIQKKYVERGEKEGSWRVFVTQVVFHRVCPEPNPRRNTMSVSLPDTLTYNRLIAKELRNNGETCR